MNAVSTHAVDAYAEGSVSPILTDLDYFTLFHLFNIVTLKLLGAHFLY